MDSEDVSGQAHIIIRDNGSMILGEYGPGVTIQRPPGGQWVPVDDPALTERLETFYRTVTDQQGGGLMATDPADRHGGPGAGWYVPCPDGWQRITDAEASEHRYPDMAHFMHDPNEPDRTVRLWWPMDGPLPRLTDLDGEPLPVVRYANLSGLVSTRFGPVHGQKPPAP